MSYPQYPPSASVKPVLSSPTVPSSSNSPSSTQKADQIAYRIFVKLVNVVADARISSYSAFTNPSSSPYDTEDVSGLSSPSRASVAVGLSSGRNERAQRKDSKGDKWFNLETPDFEQFKSELAVFKNLSTLNQVPSLYVNVLLSIPPTSTQTAGPHHGLNAAKVLVHHFTAPRTSSPGRQDVTSNTRVTRVTPAPRYILLEAHTLSLSSEDMLSSGSVELPQVYKQAISLFRSAYTLLRILPSWKLQRRLRRSRGTAVSSNLGIELQLSIGKPLDVDDDIIAGLDAPHSQPAESLTSESIAFPPITTPLGSFTMRTVYRSHPHYTLESLESLLSHHFLSPSASAYQREPATSLGVAPRREPVQFTPTLTSALERQRRESSTSGPRSPLPSLPLPLPVPERARPLPIRSDSELVSNRTGGDTSPLGSLPIRTSLPQSQPSRSAPISAHMRNPLSSAANTSPSSSLSSSRPRRISALGSVSSQSVDFPGPSGLGGGATSNSSPRFGFLHGREPADLPFAVGLGSGRTSGVMERTRKESLLGSSADRVSNPSLHGRRPSINSIHPFKSATLSSSPSSASFRTPIVIQATSASNPFVPAPGINSGAAALPSVPDAKRPSAAQSERASAATTSGPVIRPVPSSPDRPSLQLAPARYSSSFGDRPGSLATLSGGSGGTSLGSGDKSIDRPESLSQDAQAGPLASPLNEPLTNPTDDDDISEFVKAIDTRAPLRGGLGAESDRERDDAIEFPKYGKTSESLPPRRASISTPPSPLGPPRGTDDHQPHLTNIPHIIGSRAEVDETLRRMTESFRAGFGSLEGGLRSRRRRTESVSSALGGSGNTGGSRASPLFEDDNTSSGSGSPSGGRPAARMFSNNMSSSSLFAGGRRSYDSGDQIVGRMDLATEEDVRHSPSTRRSDVGRWKKGS